MALHYLFRGEEVLKFTTDLGDEIPLYEDLLSWTDSLETGIVEHRILQKSGALHQDVGAPPKKFEFRGVLVGKLVKERWRRMRVAIDNCPFGQLMHPRLGLRQVVCKGIEAQELPGDEIDTVRYTIKFVEDGHRAPAASSPAAEAAKSTTKAIELAFKVPPGLAAQAAKISRSVGAYVASVSVPQPQLPTLAAGLRDVRAATASFEASVNAQGESYHFKAQASLIASGVQSSYNAVLQGLPPIIEWPVRSTMSLTRLTASLYGGRHSKDMDEAILGLNRIPRPWAILARTVLLVPDPAKVRTLSTQA